VDGTFEIENEPEINLDSSCSGISLKSAIRNSKSAILAAALILALCLSAEGQQPGKIPKIGWLGTRDRSDISADPGRELFRRDLAKLGYVEGKNIAFEYRSADNQLGRVSAIADEFVRSKVDVIFTPSAPAALAAKKATKTIPIVFVNVPDPVGAGVVDSLERPGGNVTGITDIAPLLAGKRLELLKETIPKLSRVAVLWNPQGGSAPHWTENDLAARELGLQLHSMEVSSSDQYEAEFKEALKAGSRAVVVAHGSLTSSNRKQIAGLAVKHRLPTIYSRRDYVESGGMMSYRADRTEPYRRVALMVDKILKGAKPADIPVEQPTKFELAINLKTAKQIGLTIPPHVLARADRVIK
jgi:putative ABC transport system substrate-binding protein